MKKTFIPLIIAFVLMTLPAAGAETSPCVSITGLVIQPMTLSLADLGGYQSIEVQLNELFKDGTYTGSFHYRGVPMRALLETTSIRKEEGSFNKAVDLAIVIRNREGKQTVLSWGEIFYKNPGNVILALSGRPILPKKDCTTCHKPEVYQPRLNQYHRPIGYPKLVVASDQWANRSMENITSIQIMDPRPEATPERPGKLFSAGFTVRGMVKTCLTVSDLSQYPKQSYLARHLGEGRGFHGVDLMEGAPLKSVLNQAGIGADLNTVFLLSAPDGYRSLLSYGEVFLDAAGERLLVADRMNGQPIEKGGRFFFVPPDDLLADRDVKALEKIEVISIKPD